MGFLDKLGAFARTSKKENIPAESEQDSEIPKPRWEGAYLPGEKEKGGVELPNKVNRCITEKEENIGGKDHSVRRLHYVIGDDPEKRFLVIREDKKEINPSKPGTNNDFFRSEMPILKNGQPVLPYQVARVMLSGRAQAIKSRQEDELVKFLEDAAEKYDQAKQKDLSGPKRKEGVAGAHEQKAIEEIISSIAPKSRGIDFEQNRYIFGVDDEFEQEQEIKEDEAWIKEVDANKQFMQKIKAETMRKNIIGSSQEDKQS